MFDTGRSEARPSPCWLLKLGRCATRGTVTGVSGSTGDEQPPFVFTPSGGPRGAAEPAAGNHHLDGLLPGLGGGRFASYSRLYGLMADRLLRAAIRLVPERGLAEDAVEATFLELVGSERRPFDGRSLETWLFRTVIVQAHARAGDRSRLTSDQLWLGADKDLEAALAALSLGELVAVHLSHAEGFNDNQIGEILATSRLRARRVRIRGERRLTSFLRARSALPTRNHG